MVLCTTTSGDGGTMMQLRLGYTSCRAQPTSVSCVASPPPSPYPRLAAPPRRSRRMTASFVAILQLLERDITIDMLDYTSLSSSMPKSLHCKSRQVSTRHRRPNDDYAALHICAKIERRAFPIRAIRRPLSAIKHYHNEVNFVIHSA